MRTIVTRPDTDQPLIRTRGLTKRYGERAVVDRLDLTVNRGEVFGLLGPNGAGKTTTILMLLGLTERSSGSAEVVGLDPARHPLEVKRRVGYLPDNVGFYPTMSGRENLRYTARLNGLYGEEAEQRLDAQLDRVGLAEAADDAVGSYSRGMRQRLGIADTLLKEPHVIILDEPTIAIDPAGVVEILDLIRALVDEHGVAVLLASHLLQQMQSICDRVGIFVAGRMIAVGPVADLAEQMPETQVSIEVAAHGDDRDIVRVLRGVPDVLDVTPDRRDRRLLLVTARNDIREEIVLQLTEAGLPLLHLRRRGQELDEIYQRYFRQPEEAAEVAP